MVTLAVFYWRFGWVNGSVPWYPEGMTDEPTCESTYLYDDGRMLSCCGYRGHRGIHTDGFLIERDESPRLAIEAVHAIESLDTGDPERAHGEADGILLALVHPAVRDAYETLVKRCAWWVSA